MRGERFVREEYLKWACCACVHICACVCVVACVRTDSEHVDLADARLQQQQKVEGSTFFNDRHGDISFFSPTSRRRMKPMQIHVVHAKAHGESLLGCTIALFATSPPTGLRSIILYPSFHSASDYQIWYTPKERSKHFTPVMQRLKSATYNTDGELN